MSTYKHYDYVNKKWIVDGAGNAANIELNNSILQEPDGQSISVARAFQKLNIKLSKLEHNIAWIYQNGAKGGSGSGGGGGTAYSLIINSGKTVFYTSTNSITIGLTIQSGTSRTFFVNAVDISTGRFLVNGEQHRSMIPFDLTIPNLPASSNQIYLQAYDNADNYTEAVNITVNIGSIDIVQSGVPNASYVVGGNNNVLSTFRITNKTGAPAYLLTYYTRSTTPLQDALANGYTEANNFGADKVTIIGSSNNVSQINIDYDDILGTLSAGTTATFRTVLYSTALDYTSNYFTDQITVTSGDALIAILYGLGQSPEEASNYQALANNYRDFEVLLYYEKIDIKTFYYRYKVYNQNDLVYTSDTKSLQASTYNRTQMSCPTTGFDLGNNYRIEFEACAYDTFDKSDPTKYSIAIGYFEVIANSSSELQSYQGALLATFGSFNFPDNGSTSWTYSVPTDLENPYSFTSWPISTNPNSRLTTLRLFNTTTSTGITTDTVRYMNLSGSTYATIDRFAELFPANSNLARSLMSTGFYFQITYKYLQDAPVNQCICSLGDYLNGELYRGFEINSDYIKVRFGGSGLEVDTPIKGENAYPKESNKKTDTVTVGLNVWSTTLRTSSTTTQETYYFALYIDGVMTKCLLIPSTILASEATGWLFAKPMYIGCRSDLSNQANCNIYDIKLYAQNQPDLSIVWNYMSAVEQAHLIKNTEGRAVIDESLDQHLRTKNLFDPGSNTCLLCDETTGEYLAPAAMYTRITTNYTKYNLNYPVVYLKETATSSDMYQCIKAVWQSGESVGGTLITKKNWDVDVSITTAHGTTELTSLGSSDAIADKSPTVSIQGTSSLSYNSKNLELKCGYTEDDKERLLKINGWLPENEFTLKADVVDSAHVNNVVIGQFVNNSDYFGHYADSGWNASDNIKKKIKNTSEGFPCLVFIKYSDGSVDDGIEKVIDKTTGLESIPIDESGKQIRVGKTEFLGVYNFNLGRYAYHNLGLKTLQSYVQDTTKPDDAPQIIDEYQSIAPNNIYSMEVSSNFGDTEQLFTQADISITEDTIDCRYTPTTEADAYNALTTTLFEALCKADSSNTSGYNRVRLNTDVGATEKYSVITDALGNPLKWTTGTTEAQESTMQTYMDTTILRKYLILCIVFGLVDSVCKNMVFRSWNGIKWYPCFYDMDTAFKMNNAGSEVVPYDAHFHRFKNEGTVYTDALDSVTQGLDKFPSPNSSYADWTYYYAGMCSETGEPNRIWKLIQQYDERQLDLDTSVREFDTIPSLYWQLRNIYIKDADTFIDNYFANYINQTGAIMYNLDYRQKYVSYSQKWQEGVGLVSDTAQAQTQFLYGTRLNTVRVWFRKRLNFLDSVYMTFNQGNTASNSYLLTQWDSRQSANKTTTQLTLSADQRCKIGYTLENQEWRYIWVNEIPAKYTVETQTQNNLWAMRGNTVVSYFPEFNNLGWVEITKALNFPLLENLNLSGLKVNSFTGSDNLGSGMTNLQVLDVSDFQYVGNSSITLGLVGCQALRELYLRGDCNISMFTLPSSGTLEVLDLSGNQNITSIPTQNVNGVSQSCLVDQSGLRVLNLSGTKITNLSGDSLGLRNLPSLEELILPETLEKVSITNTGLKNLQLTWSSNKASPLQEVTITDCKNLESINLAGQKSLIRLSISNCPNLKIINLANVNCREQPNINFATLTKLQSLDITSTSMFTELDLTNCKDLSDLRAQSCTSIQNIKCNFDLSNPIELPFEAFRGCSTLFSLTGCFLIQGFGVFRECRSLLFENLIQNNKLKILFHTDTQQGVSDLSYTFAGCVGLHASALDLLLSLDDKVNNISHMFDGSGADFMITNGILPFDNCKNVSNMSYVFANTNISGNIFSERDGLKGIFSDMPQLLDIEGAFEGVNGEIYIDNECFHFNGVTRIKRADNVFKNCANLRVLDNTQNLLQEEGYLHSKDFFIDLWNAAHERFSVQVGTDGTSINNDYPYIYNMFQGCWMVRMKIDITDDGRPYLFHSRVNYGNLSIKLTNSLYSGIELVTPELTEEQKHNFCTYLFGGDNRTLPGDGNTDSGNSGLKFDGNYHIPQFMTIISPFSASINYGVDINLKYIDGNKFYGIVTTMDNPFVGVNIQESDTIPDNIFAGAGNIVSLQGFFSGARLNNLTSGEVYILGEGYHDIFKYCTSLKYIQNIFNGCTNFRIELKGGIFRNCPIENISGAFANSRVVRGLPQKLFQNNGNTLRDMSNVFSGCYNLGYDIDYTYKIAPLDVDGNEQGNVTGWSDHIVDTGTPYYYELPYDFFHYCAISVKDAPIAIGGVLSNLFYTKNILTPKENGAYFAVEVTNEYYGVSGKIPEHLFDSPNMAQSTVLTNVFMATHFSPSGIVGTDQSGMTTRGNLYPNDLFNYTPKLQNISGMFSYTTLSGSCMINPDLFIWNKSKGGNYTEEDYLPLINISQVWNMCQFKYYVGESATSVDNGHMQFDPNMFNALVHLQDISQLFAGSTFPRIYGPHKLSNAMFQFNTYDYINDRTTGIGLNVASLFANAVLDVVSDGPEFHGIEIHRGANTAYIGIEKEQLSNNISINQSFWPNTWFDEEDVNY